MWSSTGFQEVQREGCDVCFSLPPHFNHCSTRGCTSWMPSDLEPTTSWWPRMWQRGVNTPLLLKSLRLKRIDFPET